MIFLWFERVCCSYIHCLFLEWNLKVLYVICFGLYYIIKML